MQNAAQGASTGPTPDGAERGRAAAGAVPRAGGPRAEGVAPEADGHASAVRWATTEIGGHPVAYATAGSGPPALFLHGWGLGPRAYRRPIEAMAAAGCTVYAPALPGFGRTRELEAGDRSFGGYAAWVGRFLDAVGADRVALAAGHSFGGGVATAFADAHPGRAASLLLANAVGGPTWADVRGEVRMMVHRPIWDWVHHLSSDVIASPGLVRLLPVLAEDFLPNVLHNPLGMFRAGEFIRRADLVAEVTAVAARGAPVVVVWSDRDGLVPRAAFDDLRRAAGVDGEVVEGRHTWLISRPERFGELALSALVQSGVLTARAARARASEADARVETEETSLGGPVAAC